MPIIFPLLPFLRHPDSIHTLPQAVIHFAGLKAVGESVQEPMLYYNNNFVGTANLIEAMRESGCKKMVFSSSCTVYGNPTVHPILILHSDEPSSH